MTAAKPQLDPDPEDQRRDARQRVLRRAVFVENKVSKSCLILDISAHGARVQMLGAEAPDTGELTLVDARTGALYEVSIVWRSGPYAGVSFTSSTNLHAEGAPERDSSDAPLRVLAVDDDPTNRFVLEKVLNALAAQVSFAVNGFDAVAAFEQDTFDVVLMDLRMPEMDGYEAIRRIRRIEQSRGSARTPIIVVSAHTEPDEIAQAAAAGSDEHVSKPIVASSLIDSIRRRTSGAALVQAGAGA